MRKERIDAVGAAARAYNAGASSFRRRAEPRGGVDRRGRADGSTCRSSYLRAIRQTHESLVEPRSSDQDRLLRQPPCVAPTDGLAASRVLTRDALTTGVSFVLRHAQDERPTTTRRRETGAPGRPAHAGRTPALPVGAAAPTSRRRFGGGHWSRSVLSAAFYVMANTKSASVPFAVSEVDGILQMQVDAENVLQHLASSIPPALSNRA